MNSGTSTETLPSPDFKKKSTIFPPEEYDVLLAEGKFYDAIVCIVQSWGYVSQGDLCQALNGSLATEGNYALKIQPNVEVWRGLSKELGQILMDLIAQGRVALIGSESYPLKYQFKRWHKMYAELNLPGHANPRNILKPVYLERQAE
jgi:hypothetical protein